MPPRGGHGGGHHGGGHHGGGHHHHGGGHRPGGWQGGWGPGWAYPGVWGAQPAYAELVVPSCPDVVDPVLASDGRTYVNSCLANQAGASVVKHLGAPKKLSGHIPGAMPTMGDWKSTVMGPIGWAASAAMTYHGYKRNNGSILWALLWGMTGLFGVPFAVAQGFGKPKSKKNPSRLRRYR